MIDFHTDMDWNSLKPGTIVSQVPILYPEFLEFKQYVDPRRDRPKWKKQSQEMASNFKQELFHPVYYCQNCGRMEDGAHRYDLAINYLGIKHLDVEIGAICWKGLHWFETLDMLHMFTKRLEKTNLSRKDLPWMIANEKTKWNHFDILPLKGATVLDVGCQIGYTCIKAAQRGADSILGVDVRRDVLDVAKDLALKLKLKNVYFEHGDFLKFKLPKERFDIVFCLGLLHYFEMHEYAEAFDKLANLAKSHFVLELRCIKRGMSTLIQRQQVLSTTAWIESRAFNTGFRPVKIVQREAERFLYIFKRIGCRGSELKNPFNLIR